MSRTRLALLVIAAGALSVPAYASTIVVPGSCAGSACPAALPLGAGTAQAQQVFGAGLFGASPITISGIAFRPAAGNTATSSPLNVTVKALTTNTDPDTFATLVPVGGAATVFSGPITFTTANVGAPKPFDYLIGFTTPFIYNPADGNLLFDLTLTAPPGTAGLSIESIGNPRQPGTGALVVLGTFVLPASGLVTQITYSVEQIPGPEPVPEPTTLALLGGGLATALLRRRRNR